MGTSVSAWAWSARCRISPALSSGPPIAGVLTLIGDVRLPFLVLGIRAAASSLALRDVVVDAPGSRGAPVRHSDRRVLRRLLVSRQLIAAVLLVVVSFRYSIGVFEPLSGDLSR